MVGSPPFGMGPFSRYRMLDGVDPMGHLSEELPAIEAFEKGRPAPFTGEGAPEEVAE